MEIVRFHETVARTLMVVIFPSPSELRVDATILRGGTHATTKFTLPTHDANMTLTQQLPDGTPVKLTASQVDNVISVYVEGGDLVATMDYRHVADNGEECIICMDPEKVDTWIQCATCHHQIHAHCATMRWRYICSGCHTPF